MAEFTKPYYQHGKITIYHGDCFDILPFCAPVDLVLTDPPYGIFSGSKTIGGSKLAMVKQHDLLWDKKSIIIEAIPKLQAISKNQIFWGWNHYADCLPPTSSILIWDKKCQNDWNNDFADGEIAWVSRGKCRMYRHLWAGALRKGVRHGHPTEKPVELMRFCLKQFPDAKTVLDPFMGSGSTLQAAKDFGLTAIGIEKNEDYCRLAVNRLSQEVLSL